MNQSRDKLIQLCKIALSKEHTKEQLTCSIRTQSELYEESIAHQIATLLFSTYKTHMNPPEDDVLEAWQQTFFMDSMKHQHQVNSFSNILKEAASAGIQVGIFKGLYTGQLYPDNSFRSMSDFDLYVTNESKEAFSKILLKHGYKVDNNVSEDIHVAYIHKTLKTIEVHHQVVSQNLPDKYKTFNQQFENSLSPTTFQGIQCLVPDVETHVLYTTLHMLGHLVTSGFGLRGLIDICLLIQKEDFDWNKLISLSKTYHLERFTFMIIGICNEYFDLQVPKKVKNIIDHMDPEYYNNLKEDMWRTGEFGLKSKKAKSNSGYASLLTPDKSHHKFSKTDIFPKFHVMSRQFPFLGKAPFLLPLMWLYRLGHLLLAFKPKAVKERSKLLKYMIK